MINVVIDAGNTRIKIGLFSNGTLEQSLVVDNATSVHEHLGNVPLNNAIISSVSVDPQTIAEVISVKNRTIILDASTPLPINNHYGTKGTLGKDRLAALCGAQCLFPSKPLLVIDAGTCITYDYLDASGNFFGGMIVPGLKMRFRALHDYTSRLPLVEAVAKDTPLVGDNTHSAIMSGVINGMKAELEGIVYRFAKEKGQFEVIMCGGDMEFFESTLKQPIFAVPELVLIGLNAILEYNEV